jgi:hypothetical protein
MNHAKCLLSILIVSAALVAASEPAQAGEFALYGSYWDTKDLNESGGLGIKFSSGLGFVGFEARAGYFPDLTQDLEALLGDEDLDTLPDLEIEAIPVEAGINLHFMRDQSVDVFLSGGASYHFLDSNIFDLSDEVGYYLGGGLEVGGGNVAFYTEALYRSLEGTIDGNDPDFDRVDIDLNGLTVNAGVVWRY